MILWGGFIDSIGTPTNTGGRYNPAADSWKETSTINAPGARAEHALVWTGTEVIVWGGRINASGSTTSAGGRYNPGTDSWTATSLTNVPDGRRGPAGVWTGMELVVWGGADDTSSVTDTGGRYNPGTDSWTATSLTNVPSARGRHTGVWTGTELIVWGGISGNDLANTGGRYDPSTDSWNATTTTNAPSPRIFHTAIWTGKEMIVWGGTNGTDHDFISGGRYCAQPSTPIVQRAVSRKTHGNAGNFDVNLPLSGPSGIECRGGGSATGDYTIVVNFLANVSVDGSPQATVTSGIGTIGSGGVSNSGKVITSGNVVTIPLTNVTNAQTINVTLNNVNGSTNVMIPMRVLIGDVNGSGTVNATDVSQTKLFVGQAVSATNFRCDVNASGAINATDVSLVKSSTGTALP